MKRLLAILLFILMGVSYANAQGMTKLCFTTNGTNCIQVSGTNPLPVDASVTANISGFTAASIGTPISVTTGGVTGTLPAGDVVVATNVGTTNAAYCGLGGSTTVASQYIAPNGGWFAFTVGASTQLTCITATSTTTVNMVGGAGLPTGTGGGSGGTGGGGGAITAASGSYASGAYSSGSIASGAFASGALASGSIAAGAQVDLLTMRGTKNGGTAAANSILIGGVYNNTPLSLTDLQQSSFQLDANGYVKVNIAAGAAAGGTSSNFGDPFPTPGTAAGFTNGSNMTAARVGDVNNVAAATNYLDVLAIGRYNSTQPTLTDTRFNSLQLSQRGELLIASGVSGLAVTVSGVATATNQATTNSTLSDILTAVQGPVPDVTAPLNAGTAVATKSLIVGGQFLTTQPTMSNTQQAGLLFSSRGAVYVAPGVEGFPVSVTQTTSPWIVAGGGTAGSAATGVVTVQGIASMTPFLINPGTAGNWGVGATAAAVPGNAPYSGCRGSNVEQTAVTDGQLTGITCGLGGKIVVLPFTVKEKAVRGTADSTDTNAHTVIAAGSGSDKNYITDWECSNTSATNITVTFSDTVSTKIIVPATSGNNKSLQVPLVTAAATAFTFTSSSGVSTVTCNAQGYQAL